MTNKSTSLVIIVGMCHDFGGPIILGKPEKLIGLRNDGCLSSFFFFMCVETLGMAGWILFSGSRGAGSEAQYQMREARVLQGLAKSPQVYLLGLAKVKPVSMVRPRGREKQRNSSPTKRVCWGIIASRDRCAFDPQNYDPSRSPCGLEIFNHWRQNDAIHCKPW